VPQPPVDQNDESGALGDRVGERGGERRIGSCRGGLRRGREFVLLEAEISDRRVTPELVFRGGEGR
jgi:hypothetical protein